MSDNEHENGQMDVYPMTAGFAAGLLIGGLAGAVTMLLVAPQSGQRTRRQIRRRAVQLRDQVIDSAEDARDKAEERLDAAVDRVRKVRHDTLGRVEDAQQRGQDLLDQQRERVNAAVEAGKGVLLRR